MSEGLTRILLIEDNLGDARLLREALAEVPSHQFDLVHVERLSQALERLRKEPCGVVLLDLSLPDGQGLDNLARVREATPSVPILVLTGLNDEDVAVQALRVGAQDYLVKGQASGSAVVRAIRYAIERKQVLEENARLFQQTQDNVERLRLLQEIEHAITSTLDLRALLNVLMEKIDLVLPFAATTVRLFNEKSGFLEPIACRNLDEEEWKISQWKPGRGLADLAFETKAPVIISNTQADPRVRTPEFFLKHGFVSYLGVPIIVKDEVLGVLSFYTKEQREFIESEVEFLSMLAGQAAIAIHNAQLYEQTRHQAIELEKSNKGKDEFLSVMSHELRTPLNVINGYAEMVQRGMLGEINSEQKKALEKVITCAKDLLEMISRILQATSIDAEAVKVDRKEVVVGRLLDELKSAYDVSVGKEITLQWDYPLGFLSIRTDREKLKHILQNLINNAVKFTGKGRISVSARQVPGTESIEFRVVDSGIGIPEEMLPIIFEKFRQVDSSETRAHGGVGLGLYIVKKFTEMLGGNVEVESEEGKGSTFKVTLPYESPQTAGSLQPAPLSL
jgi:signal transduction histidine kinase/DNA-binding response OmpR family regulator